MINEFVPNWRGLCEKLAEDVRYLSECLRDPDHDVDPVCLSEAEADYYRACAALAQPEPEAVDGPAVPDGREPASVVGEPSDEELESFLVAVAAEHGDIYWAEPLVLARAVLSRYGRPAPVVKERPGPP